MTKSSSIHAWFDPEAMPEKLALFPLAGVVLLPRARLPLNVFEPRYLTMVQDVLGTPERMLGIIQPQDTGSAVGATPKLFNVGCAGRITTFNETEDGRFLISLTGVCRFAVREELSEKLPYRVARPDWDSYGDDFAEEHGEDEVDRERLLNSIQRYFKVHDIAADWNTVQNTPIGALIASLVMIAPLTGSEKQALLECPTLVERATMLVTLMEMINFPHAENEGGVRH